MKELIKLHMKHNQFLVLGTILGFVAVVLAAFKQNLSFSTGLLLIATVCVMLWMNTHAINALTKARNKYQSNLRHALTKWYMDELSQLERTAEAKTEAQRSFVTVRIKWLKTAIWYAVNVGKINPQYILENISINPRARHVPAELLSVQSIEGGTKNTTRDIHADMEATIGFMIKKLTDKFEGRSVKDARNIQRLYDRIVIFIAAGVEPDAIFKHIGVLMDETPHENRRVIVTRFSQTLLETQGDDYVTLVVYPQPYVPSH